MTQQTFDVFGLHEGIMQALQENSITIPSPIQQQVIPKILEGKDLIGQAQTGTGKTAAFGLPAMHLIQQNPGMQMLVLTPTRELAKQVSDELYRFGKNIKIHSTVICGGKSSKNQTDSVKRGAHIVVATPGRLLDLLESRQLDGFNPSLVVLDEADEMLDMGFLEDIERIFTFLPKQRQTLLFSATMPDPIQRLARKILKDPLFISVTSKETTNQDIDQYYYMVREEERDHAIVRLIDSEDPKKAIIFCRTKKDVDRLTELLSIAGHQVRKLHGDMEQPQREDVIRGFRSDVVRILVATDVAARGLNVSEISHVFNYHLPFDPASYVHRIGRTGRAGRKGVAGTFVTGREWRDFQRYEKVLGTRIQRGEIPTLQEVKKVKSRQLAQRIAEQGVHEDATDVLHFMQDLDPKVLASKLVSLLISQQVILGPESIGMGPYQPSATRSKEPVFTRSENKQGRFSKPFKHGKPFAGKSPHSGSKTYKPAKKFS